jgi:hypothetical protein
MAKTVDNTIFKDWLDLAEKFKGMVDKAVDEIHEAKQEVEDMKTDFLNEIHKGQYIWDPKSITISSPKIIIGNVNKDGALKDGGGTVIIKGTQIDLNGVGAEGKIAVAAPVIEQRAVNPGIDGQEAIVYHTSRISSQARSIIIDSKNPIDDENKNGTFLPSPRTEGVSILSEQGIKVSATLSKTGKKYALDDMVDTLTDESDRLKDQMKDLKTAIDDVVTKMNQTLAGEKDLNNGDRDLTRTNVIAIDELNKRMKEQVPIFYNAMNEYVEKISRMLEIKRQLACLENEKKSESQKADKKAFQTTPTGTSLMLESELVQLRSVDGDGNYRTNPDAGIEVRGNDIKLRSMSRTDDDKQDDVLTPPEAKGRITIQSRNVTISTANIKEHKYKEDGTLDSAKFPLEGDVTIQSKTINMEAVDLEQTAPGKMKETKLTEGGAINMRAEKVKVKTHNEKGESVGKFSVNSQKISMKSTNLDGYKDAFDLDDQGNAKREKAKSKELTKDSEMLLMSETMNIGFKKDKMLSKKVLIASDERTVVHSTKRSVIAIGVNLQDPKEKQRAKDGVDIVDGKVMMISSGNVDVSGKSGVNLKGEVKLNSKLTGTDIEAKNINATGALTAPNLGDGVPVSGGPGSTTGDLDGLGATPVNI